MKKQKSKDMIRTDFTIKELLDTLYQLFEYLQKCEKCCYVAQTS